MEIRGKKYIWRAEDMHPYLLVALFVGSLALAGISLWAFVSLAVAIGG